MIAVECPAAGASAFAPAGDEGCSGPGMPEIGANVLAIANDEIVRGLPSSVIEKSSLVSPSTGAPFPSVTVTSTTTSRDSTRITCAHPQGIATTASIETAADFTMEYPRPNSVPPWTRLPNPAPPGAPDISLVSG